VICTVLQGELVNRFIKTVERVAGLFIGLVALVTFVEAVVRYTLAAYIPEIGHIPDAFVIGQTLQGIAICWGIATATYADRHVTVDVLYTAVGDAGRRIFDIVSYSINFIFMALFGIYSTVKVFDILEAGEISQELSIPLGYGYFFAALGVLAAIVLAAVKWWQVVVLRREGGGGGEGGF
jgi:TRAP-type C4-dicarboxylate transport system permease small subunit